MRTAVLLLLAALLVAEATADLFATLGVARGATEKEIKTAYKKLARKLHPDTAAPDQKEAVKKKFLEVTEAYEILSDPQKRSQYESGRRPQSSGDDRQFLRHNLFHEFDGVQLKEAQLAELLNTNVRPTPHLVFFWSSNFPDCIDAAPAFKALATRLRGTSITVGSYKCDDDPTPCRRLELGAVPQVRMFPRSGSVVAFDGRFEAVALTNFAARFLNVQKALMTSSAPAILNTTPSAYPALREYGIGGNFLWATTKRSHLGEIDFGLVTLEYGPCFDCETALQLALETVREVMPRLRVRRVDCSKKRLNGELCAPYRVKDRAWTVLQMKRRCWFATKKPFRFSDEHCEPPNPSIFDGKYSNEALVNFIAGAPRATAAEMFTPSKWVEAKRDADAWAVLYDDGVALDSTERIQWSLLAASVARSPVKTAKGERLHVAVADCKRFPAMCEPHGQRSRPFVAIFGFGTRVKSTPPLFYDKVTGWKALRKDVERDVVPLHLHVLTPKNYDKKINEGLKKGRSWFVLYNAGQWCPPCTQIRQPWKEAVRIVQNSDKRKKLSMAIVECDEHKKLCNSLGIQNYPTMTLFVKGRPKMEFGGMRDGHEIAKWALETVDNRLVTMHPGDLNGRIQRGENVLVCFSAGQWCPPCTAIAPTMKKVADLMKRAVVTSFNCDDNGHFCNSFGIDGYPTVVLFTKGRRIVYESMRKEPNAITAWANQFLS